MRELAIQIVKGQKELNNDSINEMIENHMATATQLLKTGYDKNKAWDLFFNILQKDNKLTRLVMDEANARFEGKEPWTMKDYIKA